MKIVRSGDFKIMFNEKNRLFNASMLFDQLDGGEDALRDLLGSRKDLRCLITKRSFWIDMPAIALFWAIMTGMISRGLFLIALHATFLIQ